jgi:hypothetical protein
MQLVQFVGVSGVLLACASAATPPQTGIKVAFSQKLLDQLAVVATPIINNFVDTYVWPNPVASGDHATVAYSVGDVSVSNVDIKTALLLSSPNRLELSASDIAFKMSAKVHAREDIWPHPSISATLSANGGARRACFQNAGVALSGLAQSKAGLGPRRKSAKQPRTAYAAAFGRPTSARVMYH